MSPLKYTENIYRSNSRLPFQNDQLTPKQRAFCHHYMETFGDAPEAAMQAYDCSSRNSARVMAHRALHNPKVTTYLQELVAENDLMESTIQVIQDALDAKQSVNGKLTNLPDHSTRLKAARMVQEVILKTLD